jgi:hypothetical protein
MTSQVKPSHSVSGDIGADARRQPQMRSTHAASWLRLGGGSEAVHDHLMHSRPHARWDGNAEGVTGSSLQ